MRSGCSLYIVDSLEAAPRKVCASLFGEATLLSLQQLVCKYPDGFDSEDYIAMAEQGNSLNCDLTVGDIYGDNVESLGLSKELTAASIGKPFRSQIFNCTDCDYVKSLAKMACVNIANITGLVSRAEKPRSILVTMCLYKSKDYFSLISFLIRYYLADCKVDSVNFSEDSDFFCNLGAFVDQNDIE